MKVYIYESKADTNRVLKTLEKMGHGGDYVGSAVAMTDEAFADLMKKSFAPNPELVAEGVSDGS